LEKQADALAEKTKLLADIAETERSIGYGMSIYSRASDRSIGAGGAPSNRSAGVQ